MKVSKGVKLKLKAFLTFQLHRSGWMCDKALSLLPWYPIKYLILKRYCNKFSISIKDSSLSCPGFTHQDDTQAPEVTVFIIAISTIAERLFEHFRSSIMQSKTRRVHGFLFLLQSCKSKIHYLDISLLWIISEKQILQADTKIVMPQLLQNCSAWRKGELDLWFSFTNAIYWWHEIVFHWISSGEQFCKQPFFTQNPWWWLVIRNETRWVTNIIQIQNEFVCFRWSIKLVFIHTGQFGMLYSLLVTGDRVH